MRSFDFKLGEKENEISDMLYGIFFEDINYGGDGGLYGELLANRSFKYYDRNDSSKPCSIGWELLKDKCGLLNIGYNGEGFYVKRDDIYLLTIKAQAYESTLLEIAILGKEDDVISSEELTLKVSDDYEKYTLKLKASGTYENAKLALILPEGGDVEFSYVSLFPEDTFKNRENGMRRDLSELLEALSPKFMRFPGGCIVEGRSFENMYNWKDTIGPVDKRKTNYNRWQMEEYQQEGRDSSDYFQSYGIGFFEYFRFCEDIGCEPIPVINCGLTCQWHEGLAIDLDKMDSFVQDALDLVEFANGTSDTKWGSIRAEMGHAKPFNLKYIGIGNEQWGQVYFERYELFEKAFRKKYPDIKLITCAGWNSEGEEFDFAYDWMKANSKKADIVDEHFYKDPKWFLENVHRYDKYDRNLPKVFAGEYASHTAQEISERKNNLYAALTEAAFLTGVERNSDHVVMASYAPLFAKEGHQQWQPDLIWFNNKEAYGTPSYYVQKLFGLNQGNRSIEIENILELEKNGIYACAAKAGDETIIKLVNINDEPCQLSFDKTVGVSRTRVEFINGKKNDENSFASPKNIHILEEERSLCPLILNGNETLVFHC